MGRRRNHQWNTPEGNAFDWQHVQIELLMDIREELKHHNEILARYIHKISTDAARIDARLAQRISLKPHTKVKA